MERWEGVTNKHPLSTNSCSPTFLLPDKIKDAVIAKVAMQASDLYADAYSNMHVGSVKQQWEKVRDQVPCT